MRIGVVSESAEEKVIFPRYTKETICDDRNPFEIFAVRLPYSADKIEKLSPKRRLAVIGKAIRYLEKADICCLVLSNCLRIYKEELADVCRFVPIPDGKEIFYKFVPDAVRRIADKGAVNLLNAKVCISAAGQDRITGYLMRELCYDIKNFTIFTDDIIRTNKLCESFAEETGLLPKTADKKNIASKNTDVLIDLDRHRVRVGRNIVIDGVEFDFKLGGYSVDMLDIAACLGDIDLTGRVISYNCGKNKLTLSPV